MLFRSGRAGSRYSDGSQTNVPAGLSNVVAIAGGFLDCLAVKSNGTVVAWGNYYPPGTVTVPGGLSNVIAVAAGDTHCMALQSNGSVVAWGSSWHSAATNVPAGLSNVVAIAAGSTHCLALRGDGSVIAWGDNSYGQMQIPVGLSDVIAISSLTFHNLTLRRDGTVTAWGDNTAGQCSVPSGLGNVVAVAAGIAHSMALKADGSVVVWGSSNYGLRNVPAGLSNVMAIASSDYTCLALGANLAPTSAPRTLQGAINLDLAASASLADTNSDLLTYRVDTLPTEGSLYQYTTNGRGSPITFSGSPLSDSQGRFIYSPAPDGFGAPYDNFSIVANDGDTDSPPGVVTVNIVPAPAIPVAGLGRGTNGSFQLSFPGLSNLTYSVWGSANLSGWTMLGSATQPTPGQFYYNDATATNSSLRFYRVRSP